jgi:transcriptional regulator with XRE-family HTH domain
MSASTSPGGLASAVVAQIKAERAALDMPLGVLAEQAGITPRSLNRYLKGEREMTVALVERLAEALGVDLGTLLQRAGERCQ